MADVENELPVVTIIDSASGRRDKMAQAFKDLARVQLVYNDGGRIWRADLAGNELENLEPALVVLRHFRDQPLEADIKMVLTVYFGGDGANDQAAPADAWYRIWRPVSAGSGYLEGAEALELLNFAKKVEAKEADIARPNFLKDPRAIYMLPALLILCQGYLAAYARREESGWGPITIKSALECMGLPAFLEGKGDDVSMLKSILHRKQSEVASPGWWLGILSPNRKGIEEQIAKELNIDSIAKSPAVKALIDAIYDDAVNDTEKIQPPVVAGAFCSIYGKMTGRLCN